MRKQTEAVKNLIRDRDFYRTRFCNYHYQSMQFKEKLLSSKNKFNEIRQVNEKLQQKINEVKTIDKVISF